MSRFILPFQSVFDKNGHPLDGAKLYFYETGTSTPKDTYTDQGFTTPNANPVIADNQGEFGNIFLNGSYRAELKDKNDVTQPGYPADSIPGVTGDIATNIAALKLIEGRTDLQNIFIMGYYNPNDGGGGHFYWDETSTETDNSGTIIQATAVPTGRWNRIYSDWVDVRWFGAVIDGGDALVEFNAAAAVARAFVPSGGTWTLSADPTGSYISQDDVTTAGAGVLTIWNPVETKRKNSAQRWDMGARIALPNFPVPFIRPKTSDTIIALDIGPKGSPTEDSNNGFAWVDIVDTDIRDVVAAARAARIGIKSTNVEFGSRAFDGGSVLPLYMTMDGDTVIAIQTNKNVDFGDGVGLNGSRTFKFRNPNAGVSAKTAVSARNDTGSEAVLEKFSSTNTTDSGNYANISQVKSTSGALYLTGANVWLLPSTAAFSALTSGVVAAAGQFLPKQDNNQKLGSATFRWSEIFAGVGTINTSDAREKTEVLPLNEREIKAATLLSKEVGSYKYLDAVSKKGESARIHIGMTVQKAIEIMKSCDLDPFKYSFICHDEWDEIITEEVTNEEGDILVEGGIVDGGDRYGFRYSELMMFIAKGFEERLSNLER